MKNVFRAVPFSVVPAGEEFVAHDLLTDRAIPISLAEATVIRNLRLPLDRGQLEVKLRSIHWGEDVPVHQVLSRLLAKKLIVREEEAHDLLRQTSAAKGDEQASIRTIAMPTADRPDLVTRCLESVRTATGAHGNDVNLLIFDDGREKPVSLPNGLDPATVLTRASNADFVEQVARALNLSTSDTDALRYGLLGEGFRGSTVGAARNRLLLETTGECLVMIDDDTLLSPVTVSSHASGMSFRARSEPADPFYYADRESLERSIEPLDLDLIAEHERLLGKTPAAVVQEAGAVDAAELPSGLLGKLLANPHRVFVTSAGLVGDCGYTYATRFLLLSGTARKQAILDSDGYARKRLSRLVSRTVSRTVLSPTRWLMTTHVGLDNRELLPPFPPVFRNSDGVWASVLSVVQPGALTAHLPAAIPHWPAERDFDESALVDLQIRVSDILKLICTEFAPHATGSSVDRLHDLGSHLCSLGTLPEQHLRRHLRPRILNLVTGVTRQIRANCGGPGEIPAYAAADVNAFLENVHEKVMSQELFVPAEFSSSGSNPFHELSNYLTAYGRLLQLWPRMREHETTD